MDGQEAWYAAVLPLRNQVIVDVGANVGRFSQFFWEQGGGTSDVISIEPLAENIAAIQERIARCVRAEGDREPAAPRWQVEAVAASDCDGERVLETMRTSEQGWNSMVRSDGGESPTTRRVPCRRLSRLVPHATLIKVDIEGHEYTLFDEALASMDRVHTWAMELHSVSGRPLQATLARFIAHGFSLVAAGRDAKAPSGPWLSVPISAELSWEHIPVARRLADGTPFRMLHVIARR